MGRGGRSEGVVELGLSNTQAGGKLCTRCGALMMLIIDACSSPVRSPILLEVIKLYCRSAFCSARDDVDDVLSSIKHRAAFKLG